MTDAVSIFNQAIKLSKKKIDDSVKVDDDAPNELADLIANPLGMINFKSAIILFCLFLFVSSNIFIDQFLRKFDDTSKAGQLTMKAVIIQATALVLLFIIFEVLESYGVV